MSQPVLPNTVSSMVQEYLDLMAKDASPEKFNEWREKVRNHFPYNYSEVLKSIRESLEKKSA